MKTKDDAFAQNEDLAPEAADAEEALDSDEFNLKDAAARVAMSTVMAGSLAGALSRPPRTDLMVLPEATPIVQVLEEHREPEPEPEPEPELVKEEVWPLRRILKYLIVALAFLLALFVGLAKGCTSCAAPLLAPEEEKQEQPAEDQTSEDEQTTDKAA